MNAIANSRPEKAIINTNGSKPNTKKIIPEFIILYTNPLNILNNICPAVILAANLNPNDTFLAKYEINSIVTNKGKSAIGQPAGTNNEKNFKPCFWNPKIVAPNTIVKLSANVNAK